ncbi:uncharacterized protein LOC132601459 [Lycium barbarum]|uniref:uncharacterized protein LOC132601459 n=1 Tax=Lycium barbarum TaxID=112863 RepID=UPI00293F1118|nr:uncharacterized protein LOC132601459 [Lycium barbarum]
MEAFTRLMKMQQKYQFGFIGILEPFQQADKIAEYMRRIGLEHALANVSGKIWVFLEDNFDVQVLVDHPQHMSLKLTVRGTQEEMVVSLVYAKCTQMERIELWDSLEVMSNLVTVPWLVRGDFNVIISQDEKYGGLPVTINEVQDFRGCIQSCGITDLGFKGSKYTWWNGKSNEEFIFKRLDRCLGNNALQVKYPRIEVTHLIRTGSNHAPLLISYTGVLVSVKKPFKFLNFWATHDTFLDVVKN